MDGIGSPGAEPVRHSEGRLARALEDQTARLPSDTFLGAAGACIAAALALQLIERRETNKLVKIAGSDRAHSGSGQSTSAATAQRSLSMRLAVLPVIVAAAGGAHCC